MGRGNARARVRQRTRERAVKNRPLRRREACVASVSIELLRESWSEGNQTNCKRGGGGGGGGEKRKAFFFPSPSPFIRLFCSLPNFLGRSRAETLATQAREKRLPQMLVGYAFLGKARRCDKYTNKLVIFDARSMYANLCNGSLRVRWKE